MTDHRILVIGDSYMTAEIFTRAFAQRGLAVDATTMTITMPTWDTSSIREYEGDPAEVASLGRGYDVIAFHAAPVTADVLAALPDLRLVGCARGGPVNVDLDAARERGVRVTTTPGKNADARRRPHDRIPDLPRAQRAGVAARRGRAGRRRPSARRIDLRGGPLVRPRGEGTATRSSSGTATSPVWSRLGHGRSARPSPRTTPSSIRPRWRMPRSSPTSTRCSPPAMSSACMRGPPMRTAT